MKSISKRVLLAIVAFVGFALLAAHFFSINRPKPDSNKSIEQRQSEFVQYADTAQLQNKRLVFESSSPLCVGSKINGQRDCTLSKTFIYKLDGNYRDNGKEIFAYLKSKGFDFREGDKNKDKVEKKLNDSGVADNLSNSEPIIVDIYNTQNNIRVRVNLGDLGRTLPYANGQALDQLSDEQLIVGLQFFNP